MDITPRRNLTLQVIQLLSIVEDKGIIAGSYPLWLWDTQALWKPSDIDVFSYFQWGYDSIKGSLHAAGYRLTFETERATSWTPPSIKGHTALKVQLIKPMPECVNMQTHLDRFDISVSQFALYNPREIYCTDIAHYDVELQQCRIVDDHNDAIIDLRRIMKYHAKGYKVMFSDLIAILEKWSNRDRSQELIDKYLGFSQNRKMEDYQ